MLMPIHHDVRDSTVESPEHVTLSVYGRPMPLTLGIVNHTLVPCSFTGAPPLL